MNRQLSVLLTLVLVVGTGCSPLAQTTDEDDYTDIVLLHHGGTIKGKIIENNPNKKLIIERKGDFVRFEVPQKKIYAVTTIAEYDAVRARFDADDHKGRRGSSLTFRNITQVGFILGSGEKQFSVLTINGVVLNDRFTVGAGLGFDVVEDGMVPLLGHLEINNLFNIPSLFGYTEAGYSLCWGKRGALGSNFGGLTFGLGGGWNFIRTGNTHMHVRLGYRYQAFKIPAYQDKTHYISVMTGFSF